MTPAAAADALTAARAGAGWAFEGIYGALAGPVRRFLAAQGAPDPDATTQEVFLRVFRGLGRFDGDAEHLRSWVFTVARNLLVDERRAASRRPVNADAALADRARPGAEDELHAGLDARSVRGVLDALPADQREVVVLRFLVDLPLADVSTVTGRSMPSVKALQHRGLARLRRLLEDSAPRPASSAATATFTTTHRRPRWPGSCGRRRTPSRPSHPLRARSSPCSWPTASPPRLLPHPSRTRPGDLPCAPPFPASPASSPSPPPA